MVELGVGVLATIAVPGFDVSRARVVWDGEGIEPAFGPRFQLMPKVWGPQVLEVEAYLPDGRRVFAASTFVANAPPTNGRPVVTATADIPTSSETGPTQGRITLARNGSTSQALQVRFSLGGSAQYGGDYNAINGNYTNQRLNMVEIPAGAATVALAVQVFDDAFVEPTEVVVLTLLLNPSYDIGTADRAVVSITDND